MSIVAYMIERVEVISEADAKAGWPPDAQEAAIWEAVRRHATPVDPAFSELHPGLAAKDQPNSHQREIVAERYGLFSTVRR